LTPHIVRRTVFTEDDLRSFSLGGESSPLLFEIPGLPSAPPAPRLPEGPRTEPIRPPAPEPSPMPSPGPIG
jgi:hypothetical protein